MARRLQIRDTVLIECGGPRHRSRTCSWNSTGQYLASGSSDRFAKIYSIDHVSAASSSQQQQQQQGGTAGAVVAGTGRELQALTGHSAPVERVRFHPTEPNVLCTAADDRTVRLWDVRAAGTSRCVGRIDLLSGAKYGTCVASVEWHPGITSGGSGVGGGGGVLRYLAVAEKDDAVRVYDARRLSPSSSSASSSARRGSSNTRSATPPPGSARPVRTFSLAPNYRVMETHFSPSGSHLVAATKHGDNGALRIWKWDSADANNNASGDENKDSSNNISEDDNGQTFVGHTGPIYTLRFSPDGTRLATGGADALVALWDVANMVCKTTISRRTKFIRCVAYSHDSKLVASSSEEDGIEIADSETGERVALVSLMSAEKLRIRDRMGLTGVGGGADEVAFHPKAYVIACARGYETAPSNGPAAGPGMQSPQVTVARLAVG